MANAWRILGSGAHAVNRSRQRASDGRVLGKLGGMPVLLITVAGRKTGSRAHLLRRLSAEGRAADTIGDLDAQDLTAYRSCRGWRGVSLSARGHVLRSPSGGLACIRSLSRPPRRMGTSSHERVSSARGGVALGSRTAHSGTGTAVIIATRGQLGRPGAAQSVEGNITGDGKPQGTAKH